MEDFKREYIPIYEENDADFLLERMLSRIPDEFDKREGSMIYDALAPAAIELGIMYMELDWILKNVFGDTADRTGLIAIAKDRALAPFPATAAIVKGEFDIEIEVNSRFNHDDLNFFVKEFIEMKNDKYYYELICEEFGTIGNIAYGKLVPIDTIRNLKHAFIVGVIKPGEDEEDTEDFRTRYARNINSNAYGGNVDDYKDKVWAIDGVGGVKVYPVWNGGGTVKIVFTDSNHEAPTNELVSKVQEIIDPVEQNQKGNGIAPIGHLVTVEGAKNRNIDVSFNVTTFDGNHISNLSDRIKEMLEPYFKTLRKNWENHKFTTVRISRMESLILDIDGIVDVTDTKITGFNTNGILEETEVPFLNNVVVTYG